MCIWYGVGPSVLPVFCDVCTQLVYSSAYTDYRYNIIYILLYIVYIILIYVCIVVNARVLENTVAHTLYGRRIYEQQRRRIPYTTKVTFVLDYNRFASVRVHSDTYYTARALVKFVYAL